MIGVALESRGLVKRYGHCRALDGFSLAIPRGAVLGLVGPNGAGKTTWMMSVAKLLRCEAGETVFSGSIGLLPQDSELPLEMSVRSLLSGYARLQGMSAADAARAAADILERVNLLDRADASIRSLSHGMRKRVMTAQCFLGDPDLVLLDEPMNGLDPVAAERLRKVILARKDRKTTVISSHHLLDLERLCTHVAFVDAGRIRRFGSLAELTADGRTLEEVYLEQA